MTTEDTEGTELTVMWWGVMKEPRHVANWLRLCALCVLCGDPIIVSGRHYDSCRKTTLYLC